MQVVGFCALARSLEWKREGPRSPQLKTASDKGSQSRKARTHTRTRGDVRATEVIKGSFLSPGYYFMMAGGGGRQQLTELAEQERPENEWEERGMNNLTKDFFLAPNLEQALGTT